MFEEYIPQISFGVTAVICVMFGGVIFKGGNGWNKTLRSGNLFDSKKAGFLFYLIEIIVIAIGAIFIEGVIRNFLYDNIANLSWILILFSLVTYVYYCHSFNYNLI